MSRPDLWKLELQERARAQQAAEAAARAKARQPVERSCAACGVFGASFGFGVFRNRSDGLWACADVTCRETVESRAAGTETTPAHERAA